MNEASKNFFFEISDDNKIIKLKFAELILRSSKKGNTKPSEKINKAEEEVRTANYLEKRCDFRRNLQKKFWKQCKI